MNGINDSCREHIENEPPDVPCPCCGKMAVRRHFITGKDEWYDVCDHCLSQHGCTCCGNTIDHRKIDATARDAARYREALEGIKRHVETSCPTGYKMSAIWQIANKSLEATDAKP